MIPCNRIHSNRYLLYHKKIFFWSSDSTNEWCAYPSRENMAFRRFPFLKVCCCCCCCCCSIPPGWPLRAPRKVGNAFSRCFLRVRIFFQKIFLFRYPKIANFDRIFWPKFHRISGLFLHQGRDLVAFYVISKKKFKNSLIWPLLGHLKVEKSAKIMIFAIFIQIFLSLFFFRILAFFFKKLRIKSTLSTNSKKKFKNSLIQPRTSRSNFGKNSLKIHLTLKK